MISRRLFATAALAIVGMFALLPASVAEPLPEPRGLIAKTGGKAGGDFVILQSTTSTENSGLLSFILPKFKAKTGIDVRVVAVGTGQAIKNAKNGDGDVLLVHAKAAEEAFVADGYGTKRLDVMYNDFVIVGPKADPAKIAGMTDAVAALKQISAAKALFASRGDESGTHKAEKRLWAKGGVTPEVDSGTWYRATGSGMGATLNTGVGLDAYVLTDRATWIAFQNKANHTIVVEGEPQLFNQYGVIPVNPARYPNINVAPAAKFVDWLVGPEGQSAIAAFKVDGQQLFFPNAASSKVEKPAAAQTEAAE